MHKLDEWKILLSDEAANQEWIQSESDSDDDDDDEEDEDDKNDDDDGDNDNECSEEEMDTQ